MHYVHRLVKCARAVCAERAHTGGLCTSSVNWECTHRLPVNLHCTLQVRTQVQCACASAPVHCEIAEVHCRNAVKTASERHCQLYMFSTLTGAMSACSAQVLLTQIISVYTQSEHSTVHCARTAQSSMRCRLHMQMWIQGTFTYVRHSAT